MTRPARNPKKLTEKPPAPEKVVPRLDTVARAGVISFLDHTHRSIFISAVTEWDGKSINVGYLLLYRMFGFCLTASIAGFLAGFLMMTQTPGHAYPFQDVAWLLTAIWGTFTAALGALAAFTSQDSKKVPPQLPAPGDGREVGKG